MSRLMSVSLTEEAVRDRRKTVTRRLGWRMLAPGDRLTLARKVMGRRRADGTVEPLVRICDVEVVSVRRERLDAITAEDVEREGFAGQTPTEFVAFFCEHMCCTPATEVTRIEWRYLTEPAQLAGIDGARFSTAATDARWALRNRIIWYKPNGMRHPVLDRFVNLYEPLFFLTPNSHYDFDLDPVREPLAHPEALDGTRVWGVANKAMRGRRGNGQRLIGRAYGMPKFQDARVGRRGHGGGSPERNTHPMGRNPGDVWTIPHEPLTIPDHVAHARCCAGTNPDCNDGLDHYAPMPTEVVRRCVLAGSRPGGVVVDPFGGTGTVALVASVLGRTGITVDRSGDYCRLAQWRTTDPGQRAKALGVPKPPAQLDGQTALFGEGVA